VNTIVDFRSYTTARGVPTVVFVDMQKEYLATPRLIAIPEIDDALANCRKLLAHARECGLPVAFVRWLDRATPFFDPGDALCRLDRGLRAAAQRDDLRA
jgi:nicotinamidase-related amidase